MDLINDAELIHYPQQGNMGLNFQGPKGEKVSSLSLLLLPLVFQGCSLSTLIDHELFSHVHVQIRVIQVCQALLVLQDKLGNNRDHLRQRFREGTR